MRDTDEEDYTDAIDDMEDGIAPVELAQQGDVPRPKPRGPAPADHAAEYLSERRHETPGGLRLRKHRGQWLRYTGSHYEVLTQEELAADVTNYFNGTAYRSKVNPSFVSSVVGQLTARCLIPDTIELPAKENKGQWSPAPNIVVLNNGYITMASVQDREPPGLQKHSPNLVSRCLLPYDYLPSVQCPAWSKFLEEILPVEGSRRLLQEIFGYCLTTDVSLQKFFMFEGTGGNGKGVVTSILVRMVGLENTSSLSVDRFHEKHELAVAVGKLVNFTSELGANDKISEELLKRVTGGDLITVNPKYLKPFTTKFTAKIIISTNARPAFADRSNGIWRRLIVLAFPVTIPTERQDPHLEESLAREMSGILNWAIQGAISLHRRGRFQEPQASIDARVNFQKESNPAKLFFEDCCANDKAGSVGTRALYDRYKEFIQDHGYKPLNEVNFQKEVLQLPGVTKERESNRSGGPRPHVYRGITTTSPGERA